METTAPSPTRPQNPYLSRAEVAQLLGVSLRQLDRLTSDKRADFPPARRIGQRRRWLEAKVRAWAERQ